jgi:hypothetical protein
VIEPLRASDSHRSLKIDQSQFSAAALQTQNPIKLGTDKVLIQTLSVGDAREIRCMQIQLI